MPRVPLINQQVQQRAPNAQSINLNTPLEALGGGATAQRIGGAINNASSVIFKEVERQKNKVNQSLLNEAETKLLQRQGELDVEINQFRGKKAYESKDYLEGEWKKAVEDINTSLPNEELKEAFRMAQERRFVASNTRAYQHMEVEGDKYEVGQLTNILDEYEKNAGLNYATVGSTVGNNEVDTAIEEIKGKLEAFASSNDRDEDWVKANLEDRTSKVHRTVIKAMVDNGQDLAAKNYFKNKKKEFTNKDRQALEGVVRNGTILGESQRLSQDIFDGAKSESEALKEARKIKDPEVQKSTVASLKGLFNERDEIDQQQKKQKYEAIFDELASGNAKFNRKNPKIMSLDSDDQIRLERFFNSGSKEKKNSRKYLEFIQMAEKDPERFKRTNFIDHLDELGGVSAEKLMKIQSDNNKSKSSITLSNYINKVISQKDIDEDTSGRFRVIFEAERDKYPKKDQDKTETFEAITKLLFTEARTSDNWFSDPLYWEALRDDKSVQQLDESLFGKSKPSAAPSDSVFRTIPTGGKVRKGWVYQSESQKGTKNITAVYEDGSTQIIKGK